MFKLNLFFYFKITGPPSEDNGDNMNDPSRPGGSTSTIERIHTEGGQIIELNQNQNKNQTTQIHQHPQHSNIILVRGARTENGQIILQNSHELLSLLNDEDKPILLQHQRIKTKNNSDGVGGGTILFQPAIKTTTMDSSIIIQSKKNNTTTTKSTTTAPEGSILLQHRLNKNGTTDGPILLQTLKRLDKSQPILVFRSASNTTTTATTTSAKTQSGRSIEDVGERKEPVPQPKHANVPLGSGE